MTPNGKRCPRCTHWKSRDSFGRRGKNGLQSWCRPCARAYPDLPPDHPDQNASADPLVAYLKDRRRQAVAKLGTETCPCARCVKQLARLDYSKRQWRERNLVQPTCLDCQGAQRAERAASTRQRNASERWEALAAEGLDPDRRLTCCQCKAAKGLVDFSRSQWERPSPQCRECVGDYQRERARYRAEERRAEVYWARLAEAVVD